MKQVLQDLKTGQVVVREVPEPAPARGRVLVRVQASLLSAGTESAMVARGRQSLLSRIREKPQLLRQGLDELRQRGLAGVQERLASKFEGFTELGYSCAGTVVDAGDPTGDLSPGALVACAGAGAANHAEVVSVPHLLTAPIPPGVSLEAAAYATVGAIAMQGVRQSRVQLGEYVAVIGLGLVGLLAAQLLRAAGCRVMGVDPSSQARERGLASGCEVAVPPDQAAEAALTLSGGLGADAVIICAATSESAPVELAGKIARSRGRVVMVGATGMTIPREDYYLKELSFTLSRSYGPGRYDRRYEEEGQDYPPDYVRFTEQRNLRSFLELIQSGKADPGELTTHRFKIEDAPAAYALLNGRSTDRAGIILEYAAAAAPPAQFSIVVSPGKAVASSALGVGFLGAGAYAQGVLLPLLKGRPEVSLRSVMTRNGSHALTAASRFGFQSAASRVEEVLGDSAVQLVFITTRHDSHAALASQALKAGKHVWVEKPLALTPEQLREIVQTLRRHPDGRLVVGFNRPFSPDALWLRSRIGAPTLMHYRVNAGSLPADSWVNDPDAGGGRLLGEGCHFFDFLRHFAGSKAESVFVETAAGAGEHLQAAANFAATVRFANGAVGQVIYSSEGCPRLGKERFECFQGQRCGVIEDFKQATCYQANREEVAPRHRQDKGQGGLLDAFLDALRKGGPPPMSPEDLLESSLLTLAAQQSLLSHQPVSLAGLRQEML